MMTKNNFNTYTYTDTGDHGDITIDADWLDYSGIDTKSTTYSIAGTSNPWGVGSASSFGISDLNYSTNAATMSPSGKIALRGEGADVDINGVSLKDFMERVESRLGLLTPDSRLEEEWSELKTLGDRYRELEKEIHDRMKTFDILKKE